MRKLRLSRALPVVALVAIAAGCGGSSHSPAPTSTTEPISTVPKKTLELAVRSFPAQLTGDLTFQINRKQGNPRKPQGWERKYTVKLDRILMRLSSVHGKGAKRTARYDLVKAHESFSGFEDMTNRKCVTTHIVWAGSSAPARGALAIYGPKFDSPVTFQFLVPQRGRTTTRPCAASSGGKRNTVTRTAAINGNASLKLETTKTPGGRFSIGIEIQSSTAGPEASGGYTISGTLAPPSAGRPVQLCRQRGAKLTCPA